MINRRDFSLSLGALSLLSISPAASAKGRTVFRAANPVGIVDAQQCFVTCGRHPRLKFFEAEGVDLDWVNMSSVNQAMVSIATNQADWGSLAPGLFLPALAKEPGLGLVAAYNWLPRNANVVVVKPDSAIKSVAELAGKKIGIRNQGDGGVAALQTMFAELGVKNPGVQFISVGDAGVAGTALNQNNVDAIVTYDTAAARIEAVGIPLRYLPLTPAYSKLSSGWFGFRVKDVKEDRANVVGFLRACAKSTLFAHTNLGQAVRMHWELYPESKPKSKTEDESLKEIELILSQRKNNWMRRPDDPDQRFGASNLQEWKTVIDIAAITSNNPELAGQLGDPANVYTNELIDEVNGFDRDAVVKLATGFKL